jgi:acyl-CoA thioesterase-1
VRIYRFQIRIIQIAVFLSVIIMAVALVNVWQAGLETQPVANNPVQTPPGNESSEGENPATGDSEPEEEPLTNSRIVCLGDSFTVGYPGKVEDSWPAYVAQALEIEVLNAGRTYQNAEDLLARFDADVLAKDPGRVVIFAGVGDALRGKSLEEFQKNVIAMVEKAQANHIKPILALTLPFPGTEELYKAYREWQEAYAAENKITVLDFKTVLFDSEDKILERYSDDGKYPNKEGYKAMGEYASMVLK